MFFVCTCHSVSSHCRTDPAAKLNAVAGTPPSSHTCVTTSRHGFFWVRTTTCCASYIPCNLTPYQNQHAGLTPNQNTPILVANTRPGRDEGRPYGHPRKVTPREHTQRSGSCPGPGRLRGRGGLVLHPSTPKQEVRGHQLVDSLGKGYTCDRRGVGRAAIVDAEACTATNGGAMQTKAWLCAA